MARRPEAGPGEFALSSRLLVLTAMLPSLLGTLMLLVISAVDIRAIVADAVRYYKGGLRTIHGNRVKALVVAVGIDLIAVVLVIVSPVCTGSSCPHRPVRRKRPQVSVQCELPR